MKSESMDRAALDALMSRYADGDAHAFDELYRALRPQVQARLRRILSSDHKVNDALQTTFMKLHRSRHTYRPGTPVAAWVQTIARNVAYDELRAVSRRDRPIVPEQDTDQLVDENAKTDRSNCERARDITIVREAIDALPVKSRDIVRMHKLDGIPLTDIAEQLDMNVNTVRVRAHRGYKKLRELLEGPRFQASYASWGCS